MSRLRAGDDHRDARSLVWLEDAGRDVRYAVRTLLRTPGFALLAVLTLALGIGAVTVIYSVIRDVLLDPLPYPDSQRFINVWIRDTDSGRRQWGLSAAELVDYRDQSNVFETAIGTRGASMVLATSERNELLRTVHVTPNFFDVMGLDPLIGRTAGPGDAEPGAPRVAVLRHRAWVRYFAADPDVIGRAIRLDDQAYTIVGVMPPRFTWHAADVWIPVVVGEETPDAVSTAWSLQGRLNAGVSLEEAEAELDAIAQRRARLYPDEYPEHFQVDVVNVIESVVGDFRGVLFTALAAVLLLLLIACCNVANMLLARATAREREMTVRAALGAGQGRIARQVVVESLVLALCGAATGCLLAYAGIRVLVPLLPQGPLPGEVEFGLDGATLLVSAGLAVFSALLFGVAPALYSARRDLVQGLKGEARGVAGGRGRLRNILVAAEIALSLVLLVGAGLLIRSFMSLTRVDLGFDHRNILVLWTRFPPGDSTRAERYGFYQEAVRRVAALPGATAATATTGVPPFNGGYTSSIRIAGRPYDAERTALVQFCTTAYFDTLGLRFLQGRGCRALAAGQLPRTAVVNRTFAATYFPADDALGRHISVTLRVASPEGGEEEREERLVEIVGVVEDVKNEGFEETAPHVYLPLSTAVGNAGILVRTSADPRRLRNAIRAEIWRANPEVVLLDRGTLEEILALGVYAQPRFSLTVFGVFAATGTLLVAIGVFSVMSYTVSRRTREIAVRMALGAGRGRIMAGTLGLGARLLLAGIVAGAIASFISGRLLANQLWNTSPHDPLAVAAAIGVISLVALAGCYLPARRATRVDPASALRQE